jgi:hypothetical protein
MVELADTPDLGSGPEGWGFKSLSGYHISRSRSLAMKSFFLLVTFLTPVILSAADDITRINKELPTLVKVQATGKIYKCDVTIPGVSGKTIKEADVIYSLDNKGNFTAALELDKGGIIDVTHCVPGENKTEFYKKLITTAKKEAKEGKKELSRFIEDAVDPYTKAQLEFGSK